MTQLKDRSLQLKSGSLQFSFLNSGDIAEIVSGSTLINQWIGNPLDGSMNNLYLRLHREEGIQAYPLLGVRSASHMSRKESGIAWNGEIEGISYEITFTLTPQNIWFWDVKVTGGAGDTPVDVLYGQDLGLADKGAVRSNEAYMSQYIDHSVFQDEKRGYAVCSRQNQPQGGAFPYVQQGSLTGADGYSTDGFQFYGLSYKETDKPEALARPHLANEIYQYEFAYTALQSGRVVPGEEPVRFVFYGLFKENHPEAVTALEFGEEVSAAWEQAEALNAVADGNGDSGSGTDTDIVSGSGALEPARLSDDIGAPLTGLTMTAEEVAGYFPDRRLEETLEGELLSFSQRQMSMSC